VRAGERAADEVSRVLDPAALRAKITQGAPAEPPTALCSANNSRGIALPRPMTGAFPRVRSEGPHCPHMRRSRLDALADFCEGARPLEVGCTKVSAWWCNPSGKRLADPPFILALPPGPCGCINKSPLPSVQTPPCGTEVVILPGEKILPPKSERDCNRFAGRQALDGLVDRQLPRKYTVARSSGRSGIGFVGVVTRTRVRETRSW